MPLKKSEGNMYPWVTHTHAHLAGECPHRCAYCYVPAMARRFKHPRFTGPLRLIGDELLVNYGTGKTIFVDHLNDLFADAVPVGWIQQVLEHCKRYPANTYVFQTKNPGRLLKDDFWSFMPRNYMIGTTIETNRAELTSKDAPTPQQRASALIHLQSFAHVGFVTIEPIHDFDVNEFSKLLWEIHPDFVNIGADSKRTNVPEPTPDKVKHLITCIQTHGIEIRQKRNLDRLLSN